MSDYDVQSIGAMRIANARTQAYAEIPSGELRFVRRFMSAQHGMSGVMASMRVLQQRWLIRDGTAVPRDEWRDVPTVAEGDAT